MDAETLVWTLILFGGTVLTVVWLTVIAWRKESAVSRGDEVGDDVSPRA